ncbi:MAG TPA: precorrin-2 dehydrogenase/sirohydrochlorin ferrochelatase family protein [Candidatus Tripitaka californicus]|uniref:precorrin-2 dehydrogenase/sirohydrochlorin ferrochelatase family protein n=2 Tax=Candidatus Tripitaka californicus TaxID=3367616 RepID=UPI00402856D6|nr:bifunctional precorrin-2 dehydrogenase/sirohydrochlorin ferrochelatase [Planctomycetota bacterium]
MPRYYPIYLDVKGKRCVVVGGGEVAYRKALGLKEVGAEVVVIAPEFYKEFRSKRGITLLRQKYSGECLAGAFLVIAATDDKEVNQKVWEDAQRHGLLVNVVDQPGLCNFIVPSVVNRGELQISISTGGASPALAKRIRQELEDLFGPEYSELIQLLSKLRPLVISSVKEEGKRRQVFELLSSPTMLMIIGQNGLKKAEEEMRKIISTVAGSQQ